ncbi:hypothetical protein D3C75_693180 [compost metagenome]
MKIWNDTDLVTGPQPFRVVADVLNRSGQLMPKHARVSEIRLVAPERMEIGTANADPANPDNRFAGLGLRLRQILPVHEFPDFLADNSFHYYIRSPF